MTAIPRWGFWENEALLTEGWARRRECRGSGGGAEPSSAGGTTVCGTLAAAREPPGPERCGTAEAVSVPTCARRDGGGAGDPGAPGAPGHPDVPQGGGSGRGAPRVLPQVPRGGGGALVAAEKSLAEPGQV